VLGGLALLMVAAGTSEVSAPAEDDPPIDPNGETQQVINTGMAGGISLAFGDVPVNLETCQQQFDQAVQGQPNENVRIEEKHRWTYVSACLEAATDP
jgi:biopolymer transport protein ExbD